MCTVWGSRLRCGTRGLGVQSRDVWGRRGVPRAAAVGKGGRRRALRFRLSRVCVVRPRPTRCARVLPARTQSPIDRSFPETRAKRSYDRGCGNCTICTLVGESWREWRSLSGGANRGSPVGCLQRLTAYKGGRAVDHEIMGMTSRGREKSGGRKVWESRWGCTPNCGGEGQETRTVAGRDLVFS